MYRKLFFLAFSLTPFLASAYPITSYLEMVKVASVGSAWQTLALSNSYSNPVVACTYNLPSSASNEAAVRVQVIGSSIQVKIQQPLNSTAITASAVYCTISQAGSYTYPIKYEAHTVNSTLTNYGSNWNATQMVNVSSSPYKVQNYTKPVVTGQVMSYNNPNFSVFWSNNCASRSTPPSNSAICVGKHTGQTTPTSPTTEILGYFIADEGEYIQASSYVKIALGTDTVAGTKNTPPYNYNLGQNYTYATATQSAEDGGNGSWAVLYGSSPVSTQLGLAVEEETVTGDKSRTHTNEQVAYWAMEPINKTYADLRINEILYRQNGTVLREFIEFTVLSGGSILNYLVSSQDGTGQNYRLPDITVNTGDYVILHSNTGTPSSSGGVHHVYTGSTSTPLNNTADDVVLLKPSDSDATTLVGSGTHNVIPVDYVSYGTASGVDPVPVSNNGVTVSWNSVDNARLDGAAVGQSISLTPNGVDSNTSACWELTSSGDASACPSYIITSDTDSSANINSQGMNNNLAPEISLTKKVTTIYDPYNGASNPKAIPGSVLEYSITATNDGPSAADNDSIKLSDIIPANTKLCVSNTGNCRAPYFVNGSPSSGLSLGAVTYLDNSNTVIPSSPDSDGANSNVAKLEAAMNGSFAAKSATTGPNFSLKFRIVVE
ncbi:hypothetical protein OO007_11715 [Cocleimonas sp. KMM 6892]|uniref:hypothetical protein n=1 Tax=unclassified Cocleimonas TaxID=2639732 RepID=UPI002DBEED98|nr:MULTISPECIES: hypothetical protein [unclassified Cocleimonas]MEB8432895.1 hypothetical protein [Cocleimonas sp. KMM 6892]MEC4716124.1 hypothetical protein [Cocleimonas sp. KMM 6895]MEC4745585.1 hypothetical protein [Cocleimonas sp. KMM 6896]